MTTPKNKIKKMRLTHRHTSLYRHMHTKSHIAKDPIYDRPKGKRKALRKPFSTFFGASRTSIFKPHKNLVQKLESYGEFCDIIDSIPKAFVGKVIGYWMYYF